jgi:integrase
MTTGGITIRAIQSLHQGETIWDAGHKAAVMGFGARRQSGKPVYVLKYRILGRQRFFTIGPHGSPWTPETARREAKRLLGRVAEGKDPAAEKIELRAKAAETVRNLIDAYLLYAKKKQKPRSYIETQRHLLINWKPLHSLSASHITRWHVATRLGQIETERGAVSAARARAAVSALFSWAIRQGFKIDTNPVAGSNRPEQPKPRNRKLRDDELAVIWKACGDDDFGRIVKLLILTAQRRDEVSGLQWGEIDLDHKLWRIPAARTKNRREHTLPLTDAALSFILEMPRRNSRDFVFGSGPRRTGGIHRGFSGWSKAKAELTARIAEGGVTSLEWRLHDLRRTAATGMAELGVLPHIVEAVLNHVSRHKAGVAGVYNLARYEGEMRAALERWAEYIETITSSVKTYR